MLCFLVLSSPCSMFYVLAGVRFVFFVALCCSVMFCDFCTVIFVLFCAVVFCAVMPCDLL